MKATTQLEKVNVIAQKFHVLDNQQPSSVQEKVQRPGDIPHRFQAKPKCEAAQNSAEDMVYSTSKGVADVDNLGVVWYYTQNNSNRGNAMKITLEIVERFHEKWEVKENGCWEWTASTAGKGYGQMKVPGERKQEYAHRISYMMHYGEIPEGMNVCHSCDNPKCVKPSHLFLGTVKDNLQDMKNKDRHLKGERNAKSKLTEEQVRHIHRLHDEGMSQGKIGKSFGVASGTIFKIIHGQRWNHIYNEIKSGK